MAVIPFTEALRKSHKKKIYLADTSFLIPAAKKDTVEYKLKTKIVSDGGALAYNVVTRNETMHFLRKLLVESALVDGTIKFNDSVKRLIDRLEKDGREHELLKELCNSGYASMFREIFGIQGERLKVEVDAILHGSIYRDTKSIDPLLLSWDRVFSLMAMYGLDSSDAMIMNLAVSDGTFAGLVAVDKDFRICGDVRDHFDVILPDAAASSIKSREWRQPLSS